MSRLDAAAISSRIAELGDWFHNMDLGGVRTAPNHFLYDYPANKWSRFQRDVPQDLSGKSVLDIGCNGGFYSIEMKRRGADRVLGIDFDDRYLAQAKFAAEVNEQEIEFRKLSVYDVASLGERFDVVLFMGVLYHLRHPLLALDLIWEHAARDLMIFQTMQRGGNAVDGVAADYDFKETAHFRRNGYPKLHFIEHQYAGDWTNWWAPNAAASMAMLRSAGFEITAHPEEEVYICRRVDRPTEAGAVYPARGLDQETRCP